MSPKMRKIILNTSKVFSLTVAVILAYLGGIKLLFVPLVDWLYYPERKISTPTIFAIVLGFDLAWLLLMCINLKKHLKLKLVLTIIVFVLSAIILSCFLLADALQSAFS